MLVFVHINKTAGTTMRYIVRSTHGSRHCDVEPWQGHGKKTGLVFEEWVQRDREPAKRRGLAAEAARVLQASSQALPQAARRPRCSERPRLR